MSSKFKPIPADEVADQYWREQLLYVKNAGASDKTYKVDGTYSRTDRNMAPSTYRLGYYDYAILLED